VAGAVRGRSRLAISNIILLFLCMLIGVALRRCRRVPDNASLKKDAMECSKPAVISIPEASSGMTFEEKFSRGINVICPVQSCPQKYSHFSFDPNHFYIRRRSVPMQGRIAIVTDAGWNAVDAGCAFDERRLACGR
jgi:hypothetical protein